MKSEAHKNLTLDIFIPAAFQISIKYYPTTLIFSKSPIIFSLSMANQSATQNTKIQPESISLLTLITFNNP